MNFKTHKDSLPHETIKRIINILSELGIFLYEREWFSFSNNCHSLNLAAMELPGYFSNGKGVSRQYALASAYAEFMERLQSGFLISKNFGLMEEENFGYLDEIEMEFGDYAEKNKIIIENLTDSITMEKYKDLKIKFLPSYEAIEGEIKYLPTFFSFACGGNGLCAGNTSEEAICQGICEIFER